MRIRLMTIATLAAISVAAIAQTPPPSNGYTPLATFYNEDFAESSSVLPPIQWYTLLTKTFNVSNALTGLRWKPTYYTNTSNPPISVQQDYQGTWVDYTTAYPSYAYITLDQGAATFGTPNNGGGVAPPFAFNNDFMSKRFEARSIKIGEHGANSRQSQSDLLESFLPVPKNTANSVPTESNPLNGIARIYPYIYVGPSSYQSPFPATGNFYFETGLEFTGHIGIDGAGLEVRFWQDNTLVAGATDPPVVDGNPLLGLPNQEILKIWDNSTLNAPYVELLGYTGSTKTVPGSPTAMHIYRLEAVQSGSSYNYTIKVDGNVLLTGSSSVRPNCFWIGNPVYNWWTPGPDWQTMAVDYVRTGSL